MNEIPRAYDAFVIVENQRAMRSYAFQQDEYVYFVGTPERPIPRELSEGVVTTLDVLVIDGPRDIEIGIN